MKWLRGVSGRNLAVATVLFVVAITLAPPLQRYFAQRAQINALRVQLHDSQATLEAATNDLARWNDPAYVASQARSRLHYVFPGEHQYIVIGATTSASSSSQAAGKISTDIPAGLPWYSKVISSITSTNVSP
ncbi:MAG: septum formation initiator family protein [Actinomycetes bacterium]